MGDRLTKDQLEDLKLRMKHHGVVGEMAVVVVTARELEKLIAAAERDAKQLPELCCAIDGTRLTPEETKRAIARGGNAYCRLHSGTKKKSR